MAGGGPGLSEISHGLTISVEHESGDSDVAVLLATLAKSSVHGGKEPPLSRNALERMSASVRELQTGPRH